MRFLGRRYRRSTGAAIGLFAAMLALVGQIALGAAVPDDALAAQTTLAAASVVCAGTPGHVPATPRHHPHPPGGTLCPLGIVLAAPAIVLESSVTLPARLSGVTIRRAVLPPLRGPPLPTSHVGAPRGPPAQA